MTKINPTRCTATSNKTVSIPDENGRSVVLYFYPKDATPGCTTEGRDFSQHHDQFIASNAIIYGVSRDSLKSHEKFKAAQNFPFELISDEDETLCKLFDVIQLKKFMGREYLGIVRSTFLINPDGEIVKQWSDVKVKGHVEAVLQAVKENQ